MYLAGISMLAAALDSLNRVRPTLWGTPEIFAAAHIWAAMVPPAIFDSFSIA